MKPKKIPLPFDLEEMQRVTDDYAARAVVLNREAAEVDRAQRNAIRDLIAEVTMLRMVNEHLHGALVNAGASMEQFNLGEATTNDLKLAQDKAETVAGEETAIVRQFYERRNGTTPAVVEEAAKAPLPLAKVLENALDTELNGEDGQ